MRSLKISFLTINNQLVNFIFTVLVPFDSGVVIKDFNELYKAIYDKEKNVSL